MLNAASEAEARDKFQAAGYTVHSVRGFDQWLKRAVAETERVKQAYADHVENGYEFNAKLWGELKEYLVELFDGKCAYCEASFRHVAWGDIEHFRPKKKVSDKQSQAIIDERSGQPHRGYYWLAYEITNLLPSCQRCNQARGKMNQFPVVAGTRISTPEDDLASEKPLLLNPYQKDPTPVLKFIPTFGTVGAVDAIGETSIRVYNLMREELIEDRRQQQRFVRLEIKDALVRENRDALLALMAACRSGKREYSAAALAEIEDYYKTMGLTFPI
jgi:hypothetical protein